ncbi:MAG: MerR family transcriptional regulator [Bdellovibrionales bacterium]|nr:MerR family transcriptional regulator [Bdellovibrionales bacterium]
MTEELINSIQPGHFDPTLANEIQNIPSKISFKIGEVAEILNVKTHVLRYWEMEFKYLHPQKMSNGQRLYFKKDVETALLIKKLLYRDGFSVKGAKKILKELKRENRQYRNKLSSEKKIFKKINQIQETISGIRDLIK